MNWGKWRNVVLDPTLSRFRHSRYIYSITVDQLYGVEALRRGYGYGLVDIAPTTLDALRRVKQRCEVTRKPFPVWKGGSQHTVYLMPESNYKFRYLHDHQHVDQSLGLNIEDERKLGEGWSKHLIELTKSTDVGLLAWLDTVGQTNYYAKHASFPDNQCAWVYAQFRSAVRG